MSLFADEEWKWKTRSPLSGLTQGILIGGTFLALFFLELRRPLRRCVESRLRHTARNLTVAGLGAAALHLAERPVTQRLTRLTVRRRWGLLQRVSLPRWLEIAIGSVLLDYTLYWWHFLTHRIPFLWRFHQVHHVDLDLDASTALRFHFGELVLSVLFRALQILVFGISWATLSVWNTILLMEIMFHHSNVELPYAVERWVGRVLATPRMHGIHHSIKDDERNSNWSSGLSLWDRWHGTLHRDVPQREITMGTLRYQAPAEVTFPKIILLPATTEDLSSGPSGSTT